MVATWVLVVITALYASLTYWLVRIDRKRLDRESDPVVSARATYGTVKFEDNRLVLDTKIELEVLGGQPAINVCVTGELATIRPPEPSRKMEFRWSTIPVLAGDDTRIETVTWPLPELGMPGRDDIDLSLSLHVATEYSNASGRAYTGLFLNSPFSARTPENPRHGRGVALGAGIFTSRRMPQSRIGKWWFERKRNKL
jgi:hypothetical protein